MTRDARIESRMTTVKQQPTTTEMVAPADVQALADEETRAAHAFVAANRVAVVDLVTLEQAVRIRTSIGERQHAITAKLAKPKSWAYGLHKWFCDLESTALKPYQQLDAFESAEITHFKEEQDRIRQAREREETEQRRRDDEARVTAEAAHHEAAGDHAMAAAIVEEQLAAPMPLVVLPDVTKQVADLKFRREWKWRFVGNDAARAMTLLPRNFLTPDERKIGAFVRNMKDSAAIPGIDVYYVDVPIR